MDAKDICNMALASIDVSSIALLSEESKAARNLNEIYEQKRDSLMESHPWNFATKRVKLSRTGFLHGTGEDDFTSDVDDYTGSSPLDYRVEIDATGTPDTFKWSNDNGSTWEATGVAITGADQTLEDGITIIFDATTGHTSGDYWDFSATTEPNYGFDNKFKLPDDYLRKVKIDDLDQDEYAFEGGYLLTDEDEIDLQYIAQITDPDEYSKSFVEAFVARLAAEVCYALTNEKAYTKTKWEEYNIKLMKAKSNDSQESAPAVKDDSNWLDSR